MATKKNLVVSLMKQFDVESQDVYFAMLIAQGLSNAEAYTAIFQPLKPNIAALANKHLRENPQINSLITYLKAESKPEIEIDPEEAGDVERYKSKDYIILQLSQSLKFATGKDRADILMKIADLQRMKNEETKQEEEKVHYYLPLPVCQNCQYKNNLIKPKE